MIHVDLPATAECIEKDCKEHLGIKLALTAGGTLVARPPHGHGWQFIVTGDGSGVIISRCPKHHTVIEQPPPRILARH